MKTQTAKSLRFILSMSGLALVLMSQPLSAGKPAGGGGGGSTIPAGIIYYSTMSPDGVPQAYSMKADGTQKTALPIARAGAPSRLTHGGQRWFLQKQQLAGQTNFGGLTQSEVFAVREDGAVSVQLTNDPSVNISLTWTPAETATEALVAGVPFQRWNADGTLDANSIGWVYVATLRFDAAGNVAGLDTPLTPLVSLGVVANQYDGTPKADFSRFSFSPDMTRLVVDYAYYGAGLPGLRIVNVATGAETPFVAGPAREPSWSSDGTRIAFRLPDLRGRGDGIDVISPNGTGRATVFKARADFLYGPIWSPDSAFLAFSLQANDGTYSMDIYRAAAVGTPNAVNLTGDIVPNVSPLLGWR